VLCLLPMPQLLQVADLARSLVLDDDSGALRPALEAVLRDWPVVCIDDDGTGDAIHVDQTDKGYRRRSPWLEKPRTFRDPIDAVCDLTVDLVHAHAETHPDWLCMHGAAVRLRDALVLFPNTYRAGKSTLAVRLAMAGGQLFSDDVLPIDIAGRGVAMGILPRLRMPLPETASSEFRDYVDDHAGPHNHRYRYIDPGERLAPRGESAPVGAVVLLDRRDEGPAGLVPTDVGTALREAILRNFAKGLSALELLDRLEAVVRDATCLTLTYSDLDEAVALLTGRFGLPAGIALPVASSGSL